LLAKKEVDSRSLGSTNCVQAIWTEGRSPDGRSPSAAVGGRTSQSLSLRQQ